MVEDGEALLDSTECVDSLDRLAEPFLLVSCLAHAGDGTYLCSTGRMVGKQEFIMAMVGSRMLH